MTRGAVLLLVVALVAAGCSWGREPESLASEDDDAVPSWIEREQLPPSAEAGARLFATSGCLTCHTYLGTGSQNLAAPDLTSEGKRGRGVAWQVTHLHCPACVVPGSPMPSFQALSNDDLRRLARFLEASKGPR